jgi:polar amino acid transport system substrate-binding protein
MKRTLRLGAAAVALLVAAAAAEAQAPRALTFCVGLDNLPLAEVMPPSGIEVEFARALAGRLGAEARFEWIDPLEDIVEQAVLEGRCDAALGAIVEPGAMAGARPVTGVTLTEPYYDAGYLLIRGPDARPARALEELREIRIAVEGESLVTYTLRQQGHKVHVLRDYQGVIDAVAEGRAEYGYLWGPLAAWVTRDRSDVVLAKEFQPPELWSFAMAVRQDDPPLRRALNGSIRELVANGAVAEIFAKYGVPYLPPCSSPATGGSCAGAKTATREGDSGSGRR